MQLGKVFTVIVCVVAALFIVFLAIGFAASDGGPSPLELKDQVRRRMKDPDSADFRSEAMHGVKDTKYMCGEVNAKNGFGGYVGYKRFISSMSSVSIETEPEFQIEWIRRCQ